MIALHFARLERRRGGRKRPRGILAFTLFGLGCVGLAAFGRPAPWVVWNASASAPIGLYRVLPVEPIRRGDMVLVQAPDSVRRLAAERGYLPDNVPLVKRVMGLGGDTICAVGTTVFVEGRAVATRLERDRRGRSLPGWIGCRVLGDEVLLVMENIADSFDGRYFGPVRVSAIIGRLVPLWTE